MPSSLQVRIVACSLLYKLSARLSPNGRCYDSDMGILISLLVTELRFDLVLVSVLCL